MARQQGLARSASESFSQVDDLAREIVGLARMVDARFVIDQAKIDALKSRTKHDERSESDFPGQRVPNK
jgi:hypothetical protein